MPIAWVSMMATNSLRSGSGASSATSLIDSNSGRPALMPRTMTSTASGSAARNAFSRRFFRNERPQRGRPKPPAKREADRADQSAAADEGAGEHHEADHARK